MMKVKIIVSFALVLALLFSFTACKSEEAVTKEIYALDTIITITAYSADEEDFNALKAEITRLENLLSATKEQSDISRINNAKGDFVSVSDECFELIKTSAEVSQNTNGSFDISIYPAVRLWGFSDDNYRVPSDAELEQIAPLVDYRLLSFRDSDKSVSIANGGSIDLGAIAKGYIADRAAQLFESRGITSALLNFGGNIRLIGSKPDGSDWVIGIKAPYSNGYFATLPLKGQTASTAGGYERYFEENGETYHHILNPDTLSPASSDVLSSTVTGERGELCDALATAAFVAGTEGASEISSAYPDYSFILLTDSAVYVSEEIADDISLTSEFSDYEIIKI